MAEEVGDVYSLPSGSVAIDLKVAECCRRPARRLLVVSGAPLWMKQNPPTPPSPVCHLFCLSLAI